MSNKICTTILCNFVAMIIYINDASGHMLIGEGASSLLGHQFSTHFESTAITLVIFFVACWGGATIYTNILEPDFRKKQRKRKHGRKTQSGCGGTSGPTDTDGCSGCGGD